MSAETGVGPAMASGSHVKSGIWALLPVAAMNKQSVMKNMAPPCRAGLAIRAAPIL